MLNLKPKKMVNNPVLTMFDTNIYAFSPKCWTFFNGLFESQKKEKLIQLSFFCL